MKLKVDNQLTICDLSIEDALRVFALSHDEDNKRFMPDEYFNSFDDARFAVETLIRNYETGDSPLVYSVKLNGLHIGHVELVEIPEGFEIGYFIGKEYRGKGYAKKVCNSFVEYVFGNFHLDKLYGICFADNFVSKKVLTNCGFKFVNCRKETDSEVYVCERMENRTN